MIFSLCCAHFILSRSSVLVRNVFSDKTSGSQRCFIPYYITHLHLPTSSLLLYHCCTLNDDTKILTETETFFTIPNLPKPRLFSETKFFQNRNRYFFSETKNSETETETSFLIPNFPKPKPILFFRYQIF